MRGGFRLGALVALWCCLAQPAGGTTEQIQVDILGTSVTLTCPWEDGEWGTKKAPLSDTRIWTANEQQVKEMEKGARYVSRSGEEKALEIYLKLKVCEGCIELGFGLAVVIILCDLLFSLGILLLVYFCSKSRAAAIRGGAGRGRPPGWKDDRPPPVPNPDYEPIRKGQREVYAGLEPRAF